MGNSFYCGIDLGLRTARISYCSGRSKEPAAGEDIKIGGAYENQEMLEQCLDRILKAVLKCAAGAEIGKIAIAISEPIKGLRGAVAKALAKRGLGKDRLSFPSYAECFMAYAVNMAQELWQNDAGLFFYDGESFYYEQLSFARNRQPVSVIAEHWELAEHLEWMKKEEEEQKKADRFYHLAKEQLQRQLVATVYVTGEGFEGGWAKEALRRLCNGRRVFFGQNLHAEGACYAAAMAAGKSAQRFLFLSGNMIRESISVKVYHDAKSGYLELAKAGSDYKQVKSRIRIILDSTDEIEFFVDPVSKKAPVHEVMILDGLMRRENKTIRLELLLFYADRDTPVVQIRDMGFGMEKSTGRIWEQFL